MSKAEIKSNLKCKSMIRICDCSFNHLPRCQWKKEGNQHGITDKFTEENHPIRHQKEEEEEEEEEEDRKPLKKEKIETKATRK